MRLSASFSRSEARIHPFLNGNGRHARLMTDIPQPIMTTHDDQRGGCMFHCFQLLTRLRDRLPAPSHTIWCRTMVIAYPLCYSRPFVRWWSTPRSPVETISCWVSSLLFADILID